MVFTRVLANNRVWEKIKIIKWNPSLNGFYLGACKNCYLGRNKYH